MIRGKQFGSGQYELNRVLETGAGLENLSKTQASYPQNAAKKPN
jgi:hypothetical protein